MRLTGDAGGRIQETCKEETLRHPSATPKVLCLLQQRRMAMHSQSLLRVTPFVSKHFQFLLMMYRIMKICTVSSPKRRDPPRIQQMGDASFVV